MVQEYRPTKPNLILTPPPPPQNQAMYTTPTKAIEYQVIIDQLDEKLSPCSSRQLHRLEHAIHKESSARILLQHTEMIARKHHREEERSEVNKRLKKTDESITWSLKEVLEARGTDKDEMEEIVAYQADRSKIYS